MFDQEILDNVQRKRFLIALQELITEHVNDAGGIYIREIGRWITVPNNRTHFMNPKIPEPVPKAHNYSFKYIVCHKLDLRTL